MDITISLITTLVLTLINGYFSMSEMALTTAKRAVLEHEAEEGDKRAERAIKLAADSDQLLATIQVAITLVGFASSAVASTSLSDPLATWLMSFGIAPLSAIARGLAPVIITVAVAFVSIVIGELVPKRIGLANAEGVSKQVVGPLSVFQKIARPLVWLTGACSDGLARILRIKSADDRQNVSEEEIKYMVSEQDDLLDEETIVNCQCRHSGFGKRQDHGEEHLNLSTSVNFSRFFDFSRNLFHKAGQDKYGNRNCECDIRSDQ